MRLRTTIQTPVWKIRCRKCGKRATYYNKDLSLEIDWEGWDLTNTEICPTCRRKQRLKIIEDDKKNKIKSYDFRSKGGFDVGTFKGRNEKEAFDDLVQQSHYKDDHGKVSGHGLIENFWIHELVFDNITLRPRRKYPHVWKK